MSHLRECVHCTHTQTHTNTCSAIAVVPVKDITISEAILNYRLRRRLARRPCVVLDHMVNMLVCRELCVFTHAQTRYAKHDL